MEIKYYIIMAERNEYSKDVVQFFEHEICPLTDGTCKEAVKSFKIHNSTVRLVSDVFDTLIDCKSDKCITNEGIIKEKLEKFIKKQNGDVIIG
ncbi:hypothetical protein LCGC14_0741850 [marine sediment metagenome]|uniref:Uncharacterized protein n=1 Tax=marine sediment metagenome TaxID=412755 RepID=A0A0F9SRJ0_9ZZZZ